MILPHAVDAHAHEIIHHIIVGGHAAEHIPDCAPGAKNK